MSGFLSLFAGTVTIDALTGDVVAPGDTTPEWWVKVRKMLDSGAYEEAQRFLVGDFGLEAPAADPEAGVIKQTADMVGYQRSLVFHSLVEWNLTDEQGQPIVISNDESKRLAVARLPQAVHAAIYGVVSDLNSPKSAEAKARFHGGGDAGGTNGSDATASDESLPA